jgi:hypothetical protein
MPNRKVTIMQSIRSVLFTAAAITITLVAFVFTASLALALAGIAAIIAVGSAIAAKLNGRRVRAHAPIREALSARCGYGTTGAGRSSIFRIGLPEAG